jgi:hypothetical protein
VQQVEGGARSTRVIRFDLRFLPMKQLAKPLFLALAALPPIGAAGADTLYKSIDETGQVTYSSQPPKDAVEVEALQVAPGPSEEEIEKAAERAQRVGQAVDDRYQALMERREQEEQLRKEAEEAEESARIARETAERLQRIEESLEPEVTWPYYPGYPYNGWRPYPPYRPWPRPPRDGRKHHRRFQDHINTPARDHNRPFHDHINSPARTW